MYSQFIMHGQKDIKWYWWCSYDWRPNGV